MNEETDLVAMAAIAQRFGKGHQVIVMHPHDIIGQQQFFEVSGEILVDAEVAAEIAAGGFGGIEPVVKDWGPHPIREAAVKFLIIGVCPDRSSVRDGGMLGG